jgi:hypothetical protein
VVVIVKDPQGLDVTDVPCVDVLQLLPRLDYHALLVFDEDDVLENLDVLILVVLVQLAFVLHHKVRVG